MRYLENGLYCADVEKTIAHVENFEYFREKKVLILGATGLIGSYLTDCLIRANDVWDMKIHIYASSRSMQRLEERFGEENRYVHFVECSVENVGLKESVDIIVHCASNAHPKAFREQPVETMIANLQGTYQVCELARKNPGCRVLYVSSGEVQEEVDHLSTRACYPVSKKAAETMCLCYFDEYNVDVVIARPCHTFGANVTVSDNRATAQFIACASAGEDIVMKSSGQQIRSFAYVGDCVCGLLTLLTTGCAGQVYNVASDEIYSIRQFAELCAASAKGKVVFQEANVAEQAESSPIKQQIMDNKNLKGLGWKCIFSIKEGIEHSVAIQKQLGVK